MARTKKTARVILAGARKMSAVSKMLAVNHIGFSTSHLDEEKPSDDEDSIGEELSISDDDKKMAATEENQVTKSTIQFGFQTVDGRHDVKPPAGSIENESRETKERESVMNEDDGGEVNNETERNDLPNALPNEDNESRDAGQPVNEDANIINEDASIQNLPVAPNEEVEVEAGQPEDDEVVEVDPVPPVVPTTRYLLQFRDQVSRYITKCWPVCLFSYKTLTSFAPLLLKHGEEREYTVPRLNLKMKRLFSRYCAYYDIQPSSCRFLEDGVRVDPQQTYGELVDGIMPDPTGDVIVFLDCMLEQTGGRFHWW
jgi:hypothetical protein